MFALTTLNSPNYLFPFLPWIHHTFERLYVKNCPVISWSAWTGNELALNLAPTLNQAKVIKRNMNCDASEKWQNPSGTKDVSTEKLQLLRYHILKLFVCFCVNSTEKRGHRRRERLQLILSISLTFLLCLIIELLRRQLFLDGCIDSSHQAICSVA